MRCGVCDGNLYTRELCLPHCKRRRRYGDAFAGVRAPPPWRSTAWVMARHLGRVLRGHVVHRLDGDRLDSRLENLDLWSTTLPKGQRVEDRIEHAVETLRSYRPQLLAVESDPSPGSRDQ